MPETHANNEKRILMVPAAQPQSSKPGDGRDADCAVLRLVVRSLNPIHSKIEELCSVVVK